MPWLIWPAWAWACAPLLRFRLRATTKTTSQNFISAIQKIEEVVECHHVTGQADFILKVVASDIPAYQNLMLEKVSNIEVVDNMQSTVILSTFKDSKVVPLP
jgi:Lrp/AsnC family leucine-responsive transcriptional regulator